MKVKELMDYLNKFSGDKEVFIQDFTGRNHCPIAGVAVRKYIRETEAYYAIIDEADLGDIDNRKTIACIIKSEFTG